MIHKFNFTFNSSTSSLSRRLNYVVRTPHVGTLKSIVGGGVPRRKRFSSPGTVARIFNLSSSVEIGRKGKVALGFFGPRREAFRVALYCKVWEGRVLKHGAGMRITFLREEEGVGTK